MCPARLPAQKASVSSPRQPARGPLWLHCSTWNDPGAAMRVESVRTRLRAFAGNAKECSKCNPLHHTAGPQRRLCFSRLVHHSRSPAPLLECFKWNDLGGTRIDGSVRARAWVCAFADGSPTRNLPRGANRGRSRTAQEGYPCQLWRLQEIGSDAVVPPNASDLEREPFGPPVSPEQGSSHTTIVPRLFHVEQFTRTLVCGRSQGALSLRYSASTNPGGTRQAGSRDSVFRGDFDQVFYAGDSASRWRTKARC